MRRQAGCGAVSGKWGNDPEDSGGVWRDGSGGAGDGARGEREPVFAEGAEGFSGGGAASAGGGGNVTDDFADATEGGRDSHAGVVRTGRDEGQECVGVGVGS